MARVKAYCSMSSETLKNDRGSGSCRGQNRWVRCNFTADHAGGTAAMNVVLDVLPNVEIANFEISLPKHEDTVRVYLRAEDYNETNFDHVRLPGDITLTEALNAARALKNAGATVEQFVEFMKGQPCSSTKTDS